MAKREFQNAQDAIKSIGKISGVTFGNKSVKITKDAILSASNWGALDYLKNKCEYVIHNENVHIL